MNRFFSSLAVAAMAAAFVPQVVKAQGPALCPMGNVVMNGTYVMSAGGTVTGVGPVTFAGLVVYNGDGTGTLVTATESLNGAISKLANVSGVYTVNRDCTGSKTFGSGASAQHFDFVITPDGSTITWVETDNGTTISGTAVRAGRAN
ncbi:MAG TPA: hypothetical protein VIY49_34980 [Bryobacteraceae bacterium]